MWFRLDAAPDIELSFQVEGVSVVMPNALPLVVLTEDSARELCLELALQLKLARNYQAGEAVREVEYEEWVEGMTEEQYRAHIKAKGQDE